MVQTFEAFLRVARPWFVTVIALFALVSCTTYHPGRLAMMEPPAVFKNGEIDPFGGLPERNRTTSFEIFYATDRQPASEKDRESYYLDQRGEVLRLGSATLRIGDENMDWDTFRNQVLFEGRAEKTFVELIDVEEFGMLASSMPLLDPNFGTKEGHLPGVRLATAINEGLQRSGKKDIYVYVHGIRVNFENPLLISSEIWQYLDRDGVLLAYSWPSTTKSWLAYFADIETAASTVRNLRLLLAFLAAETDTERIHILCYSAGSRVVAHALNELRLMHYNDDEAALRSKLKIGKVIFVGPDIELMSFRAHYRDRVFELPERIIIYLSRKDNVLKWARRLFREPRLGDDLGFTETDLEYLAMYSDTVAIDVTDAEQAMTENGHRYFRKSPWVMSDILVTLKFGLEPAERGLSRNEREAIWQFPPDYVERLKEAVAPLYAGD
ncbi:MAG: alpha/beta hydrolase [Candidatus Hydrogenedentota bacterium]|nr:MAG: alpha/beta hydrolase [Candidatus Hydrogenedentota bacterium]